MRTRSSRRRAVRNPVSSLLGAALVSFLSGCGPGGIIATATAIGVAQVIDIASIPYRMLAGAIALAIVNSI